MRKFNFLFVVSVLMILFGAGKTTAQVSTLYGLGEAFGKWDSSEGIELTETEAGSGIFVFEKELKYSSGDNKQFKFTLSQGNWDAVEFLVPSEVTNGSVLEAGAGAEYDMFRCSETAKTLRDHFWGIEFLKDGLYRVTVNTNTDKLKMELLEQVQPLIYVVGDAVLVGWDAGAALQLRPEGDDKYVYTGYFAQDAEFKFLTKTDWGGKELRNASAEPYFDMVSGGILVVKQGDADDNKFKLAEAGNYKVTCDLKNMTIKAEKIAYQEEQIKYPALYLVGSATPGGWDLGKTTPVWRQDTGNMFTYSAVVSLTADGSFKITSAPGKGFDSNVFWFRDETDAAKISTDADGDRQWSVEEDGDYIVTIDLINLSISITKTTSGVAAPSALDKAAVYAVNKNIVVENAQGATLNIYSVQGQLLKTAKVTETLQSVAQSTLGAGIYVVTLSDARSAKSYKIVLR